MEDTPYSIGRSYVSKSLDKDDNSIKRKYGMRETKLRVELYPSLLLNNHNTIAEKMKVGRKKLQAE